MNGGVADIAEVNHGRETRHGKLLVAWISSLRLQEQEIIVRNISVHGLGAKARSIPPFVGERVTLRLPDQSRITGMVRWVHGHNFGISSDQDLVPEAFRFPSRSWHFGQKTADSWTVSERYLPTRCFRRPGFKVS